MNKLTSLSLLCIILSGLLIGWGFYNGSAFALSGITGAIAVIWMAAVLKKWKGVNLIAFSSCTFLAVYGMWGEMGIWQFLLGQILTIAAWDLTDFRREILEVHASGMIEASLNAHYLYLTLALALGLILSIISLNLQIKLSFLGVLVLGILILGGMRALLRIGMMANEEQAVQINQKSVKMN